MSRTRNPFSVHEISVTEKIGNKKSVNSQEIDKSSKLLSVIRGW